METIPERIRDLPAPMVGRVVEQVFAKIFERVPVDRVRENADAVVEAAPLTALDNSALQHDLSPDEAECLGRIVLERLAEDPALSPLVDEAINEVQGSDKLVVETLLAIGFVVNLTLLVATTKIEVVKGPDGTTTWNFHKGVASAELVKTLIDPLAKLVKPTTD